MGGEGPGGVPVKFWAALAKIFLFFIISAMFENLLYEPRQLKATEKRLQAIYDAAYLGLKGDSLAIAAGMLPAEYRQLCQFDPLAEMAELKGRADSEVNNSRALHDAAQNGDAKAALAVLQHSHGWTARQEISVDVYQKISITQALADANARIIDGTAANLQLSGRTDAYDASVVEDAR